MRGGSRGLLDIVWRYSRGHIMSHLTAGGDACSSSHCCPQSSQPRGVGRVHATAADDGDATGCVCGHALLLRWRRYLSRCALSRARVTCLRSRNCWASAPTKKSRPATLLPSLPPLLPVRNSSSKHARHAFGYIGSLFPASGRKTVTVAPSLAFST